MTLVVVNKVDRAHEGALWVLLRDISVGVVAMQEATHDRNQAILLHQHFGSSCAPRRRTGNSITSKKRSGYFTGDCNKPTAYYMFHFNK